MTDPTNPQPPADSATAEPTCKDCKGTGVWGGTSPRGVCGQAITECKTCHGSGFEPATPVQLAGQDTCPAKGQVLCAECGKMERSHRDGQCYPDTSPEQPMIFRGPEVVMGGTADPGDFPIEPWQDTKNPN